MIKLIAIDLDGTFLTDDKRVLEENVQALHQVIEKGVHVVICTGRTLPGVRRFIEPMGLSQHEGYIILNNGAETHHLPNFEIQTAIYQSRASREALIKFFRETRFNDLQLVGFDLDSYYLIDDTVPTHYVEADAETLASVIKPISGEAFIAMDDIFEMMVLGAKEDLDKWTLSFTEEITQHFDYVRSQPVIIEFLSPNTNKATALKSLCDDLSITSEEVMALGDEQNDIEMLKWARHSVAMGNASDAIKELARYTTVSNNEAGVAKALHKMILEK